MMESATFHLTAEETKVAIMLAASTVSHGYALFVNQNSHTSANLAAVEKLRTIGRFLEQDEDNVARFVIDDLPGGEGTRREGTD